MKKSEENYYDELWFISLFEGLLTLIMVELSILFPIYILGLIAVIPWLLVFIGLTIIRSIYVGENIFWSWINVWLSIVPLLIILCLHVLRMFPIFNNRESKVLLVSADTDRWLELYLLIALDANLEIRDDSGWTALMLAASKGHTECVNSLMEAGADKEAKDNDGQTALMLAALNNTECTKSLIEAGADKEAQDNNGRTALILAAFGGPLACLKSLIVAGSDIEAKDNDGQTALILAAWEGNLACLKSLIEADADKEAKDNNGRTALMFAAWGGHKECAEFLIEADADKEAKNNNGRTALMIAAWQGNLACLKSLIEADADKEAKDNNGWTALMLAASKGHTECVKSLIEADADKEAKNNNGRTALMIAAWQGNLACLKSLIEADADKEAKDNNGWTALMLAASKGHTECVKSLIEAGADLGHADIFGKTAFMKAVDNEHQECCNALLAAGVDSEKVHPDDTQWLAHKLQLGSEDFLIKKERYSFNNQDLTLIYAAAYCHNYNAVKLLARQGRLREQLQCSQEEFLAFVLDLKGDYIDFVQAIYENSIDIESGSYFQLIKGYLDYMMFSRAKKIKKHVLNFIKEEGNSDGGVVDYLGLVIMTQKSASHVKLAEKKAKLGSLARDIGGIADILFIEYLYRVLLINGKTIEEEKPLVHASQKDFYRKTFSVELYELYAFFLKIEESRLYDECKVLLNSFGLLSKKVSFPKLYNCRIKLVYQYAREQYGEWFKAAYKMFTVSARKKEKSDKDMPRISVEMIDFIFSYLQPYYKKGYMVIKNPADRVYVRSSKYRSAVLNKNQKDVVMIAFNESSTLPGVSIGILNKWFIKAG